ncbi:hypothetical protein NKDENANG_01610 [Candidatus Entotheonellaceae bacterium PAL068K]
MRRFNRSIIWLSVVMLVALWSSPPGMVEEPQYGGILKVALAGDPPSLDMHQEQPFKVLIPMSTTLQHAAHV